MKSKKLIAIIIASTLAVMSLTACESSNETPKTENSETSSASTISTDNSTNTPEANETSTNTGTNTNEKRISDMTNDELEEKYGIYSEICCDRIRSYDKDKQDGDSVLTGKIVYEKEIPSEFDAFIKNSEKNKKEEYIDKVKDNIDPNKIKAVFKMDENGTVLLQNMNDYTAEEIIEKYKEVRLKSELMSTYIAQTGDARGVIDEETIADGVLDKYIMTIDSKTKPRAFHLADFMKENFGENSVKKVRKIYIQIGCDCTPLDFSDLPEFTGEYYYSLGYGSVPYVANTKTENLKIYARKECDGRNYARGLLFYNVYSDNRTINTITFESDDPTFDSSYNDCNPFIALFKIDYDIKNPKDGYPKNNISPTSLYVNHNKIDTDYSYIKTLVAKKGTAGETAANDVKEFLESNPEFNCKNIEIKLI